MQPCTTEKERSRVVSGRSYSHRSGLNNTRIHAHTHTHFSLCTPSVYATHKQNISRCGIIQTIHAVAVVQGSCFLLSVSCMPASECSRCLRAWRCSLPLRSGSFCYAPTWGIQIPKIYFSHCLPSRPHCSVINRTQRDRSVLSCNRVVSLFLELPSCRAQ